MDSATNSTSWLQTSRLRRAADPGLSREGQRPRRGCWKGQTEEHRGVGTSRDPAAPLQSAASAQDEQQAEKSNAGKTSRCRGYGTHRKKYLKKGKLLGGLEERKEWKDSDKLHTQTAAGRL